MFRGLSLTFLTLALTVAPAFADQLTLGGCSAATSVTVTSGPATVNCNINLGDTVASIDTESLSESGNLALGTFGITFNVTNTPVETAGGISDSSYLDANYVFSSSLSSGTAQFALDVNGSFSSSGGNGQMEFEYSGGPWTVNGVSVSSFDNYAFWEVALRSYCLTLRS